MTTTYNTCHFSKLFIIHKNFFSGFLNFPFFQIVSDANKKKKKIGYTVVIIATFYSEGPESSTRLSLAIETVNGQRFFFFFFLPLLSVQRKRGPQTETLFRTRPDGKSLFFTDGPLSGELCSFLRFLVVYNETASMIIIRGKPNGVLLFIQKTKFFLFFFFFCDV